MNNLFIDTVNPSVDIIANYIGFPNPSQTLSTASKYMYIKPLTTGDFEIRLNNIPNIVLGTDWSQLATGTQMTTAWYTTASVLMGFINPNAVSGPTMRIMGTSNQYIYYNTSNNFGNYNSTTSTTNWEITSTGLINCKGLNAGSNSISTSGSISGGLITGTSLSVGSGSISTSGSISGNTINATTSVLTNLLNAYSGGIITCNNTTRICI